jgi:tetratricopeptide (TPR) repeat protein
MTSSAIAPAAYPAHCCRWGISPAGLLWFISQQPADSITSETTTSDVCHMLIKPATVPAGWECRPTLKDPEKRWYSHKYVELATGRVQTDPPPGTRSFCEKLAADPATAHWVGRPNLLLSHAWLYKFEHAVTAIESFADKPGAGAGEPKWEDLEPERDAAPPECEQYGSAASRGLFVWFDCFSLDQHAVQQTRLDSCATTCKEAIRLIGHTVMILPPFAWHMQPEPLTRAWCLWELWCTIATGAVFSVCLEPAHRAAFEAALLQKSCGLLMETFADIDVEKAEASNSDELFMIMNNVRQLPGSCGELNTVAASQMRLWMTHSILREMEIVRRDPSTGALKPEALAHALAIANMLDEAGDKPGARRLCMDVVDGLTVELGPDHTDTLSAQNNFAVLLQQAGNMGEARRLYELVVAGYTSNSSSEDMPSDADIDAAAAGPGFIPAEHFEGAKPGFAFKLGEEGMGYYNQSKELAELKAVVVLKNTDMLTAQMNLAILLQQAGEITEARRLYGVVVAGRTMALGAEHAETLTAQMNLAVLLKHTGQMKEARQLYELMVAGYTSTLGVDHVDTLSAQMNLAVLLKQTGQTEEARRLYERVVSGRAAVLGPGHADTLTAQMNLALLLAGAGETEGAQRLYELVVAGFTARLGVGHDDTLRAQMDLAIMLNGAGKMEEARDLFGLVAARSVPHHPWYSYAQRQAELDLEELD